MDKKADNLQKIIKTDRREYGAEALAHELDVYRIAMMDIPERKNAEAALRERERQSSAILDAASESIWLMTLEGDILNANSTAAKRLDMEVRDVVGKNCFDFLDTAVARLRREKIKEMVAADGPIRFEDERSGIFFDHTFFPVRNDAGKIAGLAIFSRDVTERKLAENSLLRSNARFEILAYTAQELLLSRKPQQVVESLCRKVMEHLDCQAFFNFLVDEKAGKLRLNASAGIPAEEAKRIEWLDFGVAVCGCAARDGCRIVAEHIPSTPDVRTDLVKSYGIKAYACHPLLAEDKKVIGTLSFGTTTRETFSFEDLAMMKAVADQVAVAMARVSNEEALKQSEERFRAIAEATPVGVGVIGVPEAKFLYVNMAYIKTFGYDEGDLIGQGTPQIYWNLDDRDKILGLLRKNGSVADYEARLKRKDGTPFWALCSARPITYDNRPALLGAFVDITERKSSEEKLDRLNRALAALGKSSQAMMRAENEEEYLGEVCDIIVKECGYKMTWIGFADNNRDKTVTPVANAGFEEGYLETLNLTWADTERGRGPTGTAIRTGTAGRCRNMLTDPAFAPWRSEAVKRGYASSIVIPLMGRERAFGAITIYSTEPDPFTEEEEQLLMELARDVSQGIIALRLREARNRAEELLRAERNFSNAVIQTTGGLIVGLDTKGRIQLFNHACEKTTGYTFNEIKGRVFWDFLLLPGERERVKKVFESIQNGPASAEMEYENFWVAKDGARRYIKWANSAIKNKEGEIRLIIGTGIDITERKSIEDAQNFLLQCGYTGSGDDFFRSLARYLSESLDMEYICIDRLAGDGLRAETVAVYNSGIFEPNATYTLKETPCGDVVGKSICCFREKVCALFPRDAALRDLKAESYIGATLWSYDGTPIGLIAIIGQKPLVNPGTAEAMLKLVAIRAAGELERLLAETELKKQAGELKTVNEDLTRFNAAAVNRELRMVELKKELNDVCVRLGETPRYPLVIDDDDDTKRI